MSLRSLNINRLIRPVLQRSAVCRAFHSSSARAVLYPNANLEVHIPGTMATCPNLSPCNANLDILQARSCRIPNYCSWFLRWVCFFGLNNMIVTTYFSWCGPCHQVAPIIEKLTNESYKSGSTSLPFDLVKIDTDTEVGQILAGKYKVHAQLNVQWRWSNFSIRSAHCPL